MKTVKFIKQLLLLCVALSIIVCMCGCMDNQSEFAKESMEAYAVNKYGREFEVVDFTREPNGSKGWLNPFYRNKLFLSDGEHLFVVYHTSEHPDGYTEMSDNYPEAVVNKKISDYLNNGHGNPDIEVFADFLFSGSGEMSLEYAVASDISTISTDYSRLMKAVAVVMVSNEISTLEDEIYEIYKNVLAFDPELIDFQVIYVENPGKPLMQMLKCMPGHYETDWERYAEIIDFIGVWDTTITSASELIKEGT